MFSDILMTALATNYFVWWAAQVAAIVIIIYFVVRRRFGFLGNRTIGQAFSEALDARQAQIREQLEAAERSREEARKIQEAAEREVEEARRDGEGIVTRAASTSEAIQREMHERAREEYQRIVGQARSQIEYERRQAEMALRRSAADIVVDAAREIVERYLDPPADKKIIDESLGELRGLR